MLRIHDHGNENVIVFVRIGEPSNRLTEHGILTTSTTYQANEAGQKA